MTDFKLGDKVRLKPGQEENVLGLLPDGVFTVSAVEVGGIHIRLAGIRGSWFSYRFELAEQAEPSITVPERDDEIEVVLRAKVSAVLRIDNPVDVSRTVVYLRGEDAGLGQAVYLYGGGQDGVRSLTVLKPAKPKLDLDALPEKTIVQAPTGEVYVKREGDRRRCFPWGDMNGGVLSSSDLHKRHDELFELVRKEVA